MKTTRITQIFFVLLAVPILFFISPQTAIARHAAEEFPSRFQVLYIYKPSFVSKPISSTVYARIKDKSYPANCPVSLDELRYITIKYIDTRKQEQIGEMIVNRAIDKEVLSIFYELYQAQFPIEKIKLVDEYNADDELSMQDNNTSCFNFRYIAGTTTISKHGYGLAIDINPLYNPYVKTRTDGSQLIAPITAESYVNRNQPIPGQIVKNDICYTLFAEKGFTWGGDWDSPKDYQHFEK